MLHWPHDVRVHAGCHPSSRSTAATALLTARLWHRSSQGKEHSSQDLICTYVLGHANYFFELKLLVMLNFLLTLDGLCRKGITAVDEVFGSM